MRRVCCNLRLKASLTCLTGLQYPTQLSSAKQFQTLLFSSYYVRTNTSREARLANRMTIHTTKDTQNITFKEGYNKMSIEDFLALSHHDVEKELHKIKRTMNNFYTKAKYEEFLDCANDFEQKVSAVMGKENVIYASSLNNLALAQKSLGKLEEAMDTYTHAIQVYDEAVGKKHPSYASALANLGLLYKEQAEASKGIDKLNLIERAKEALTDSYNIRNEIGAPKKEMIMSRNHIASLHLLEGKLDKAEESLRQSVSEARAVCDEHDLLTATSLNNLGYVLKRQGRPEQLMEALSLYEEALSIRRELLPADHPDVIISMNNLAELHFQLGNKDEAENLQKSILTLMETTENERLDNSTQG